MAGNIKKSGLEGLKEKKENKKSSQGISESETNMDMVGYKKGTFKPQNSEKSFCKGDLGVSITKELVVESGEVETENNKGNQKGGNIGEKKQKGGKSSEKAIFFISNNCFKNEKDFETLVVKTDVESYIKKDFLSQLILMDLHDSQESKTQKQIRESIEKKRDFSTSKATLHRRLSKLLSKGYLYEDSSEQPKTYRLSIKGKSLMFNVLQVLKGYEKHDINEKTVSMTIRAHKLVYKAEVYALPKSLKIDRKIKGKQMIGDWKVWEVRNNIKIQREIPIKIRVEDEDYNEKVMVDFMYKVTGDRNIFIYLPQIYAESFSDGKRKISNVTKVVLEVLRKEGFKFKGGDYYSTELTEKQSEWAMEGHPFALLCRELGISEMRSDKLAMDSSKKIPELEGVGMAALDTAEVEWERLNAQATVLMDKNGKSVRLHDPIRADINGLVNKKSIEELKIELDMLTKIVGTITQQATEGFQQLDKRMGLSMGGLPIQQQHDLIMKVAELKKINEDYKGIIKTMKKNKKVVRNPRKRR